MSAVLAIVSDTHGIDGHRLEGRTLTAVREADRVVHAGDFTTCAVYAAFREEAAALTAVAGNNDERALRDRLPSTVTVEWRGLTIVVVHGHEHSETALSLLARQEGADIVVVGHSHKPSLSEDGYVAVNPGSHADPRQFEPAHAEVLVAGEGYRVRLRAPGGSVLAEVCREGWSGADQRG